MIKSTFLILVLSFSLQCLIAAEEAKVPAAEPISARQMIDEHLRQRELIEREAETPTEEESPLEEEFPAAVEADDTEIDELMLLPDDEDIDELMLLPDVADIDELFLLDDEDDRSESTVATDTADLDAQQTYEKADSLPPALLLRGTPGIDEDSGHKKEDIIGRFVPEPHPLNRRQKFYRWVLETFEGHRVPLKSNLKLLQEIRSEKFLDGFVKLRGYYLESGYNEQLKYFVVESVAGHEGPDGLVEPAVVEEVAPASFTLRDKIRR